jgi:hypothetical protein
MINFILLVHKNPDQVKRLIDRLLSDESYFYIHVDKGVDIAPFKKEVEGLSNVYFLENGQRMYGTWVDIGIVEGTINALEQILKDKRKGYCVLLSGQDYPIKSIGHIISFFKNSYGINYLTCATMPSQQWPPDGGMNRLTEYKVNRTHERGAFDMLPSFFQRKFYSRAIYEKITHLFRHRKYAFLFKLFRIRKHPRYLQPYGGSQWWAIPIETVKSILDYLHLHPDFLVYHKDTLVPDEILFQSIIMGLYKPPYTKIASSVTYVDWDKPNVTLPVTFTADDFNVLSSLPVNFLFARKFDMANNSEILDLIDSKILTRINK